MARYQIILAYDGTEFFGSQRQAKKRTVQGELEKALTKLGWSGRSVLMAGRTDTGVHASGQVAAFDLVWSHGTDDLLRALNANLPLDMVVHKVNNVAEKFHPRFDATSRRYRYRLFCQTTRDPLRERYAWRVWPPVEFDALAAIAQVWLGQHDFAAFGTPPRPEGSTIRTVHEAGWQTVQDELHFEVQANAFLYRMVRRLVFIQVAAVQGKLRVEDIARALSGQAGASSEAGESLPSGLAPAQGLSLIQVSYPSFLFNE
jgi:tRNA pseudouridine38-40 synthase